MSRFQATVAAAILCASGTDLAIPTPAEAQSRLTCNMLWKEVKATKPQTKAVYRDFARRCSNHPRAAEARRWPPTPAKRPPRQPPPPPNPCRTADKLKTNLVVVSRQSFDEGVLTVLAREMGCDRYWFRMGATKYPGSTTNLLAFGPSTSFRQIQAAVRGALRAGAPIAYLGFDDGMPTNTIWLAHNDPDNKWFHDNNVVVNPLTPQDWDAITAVSTQEQFDAIYNQKGIHFTERPTPP